MAKTIGIVVSDRVTAGLVIDHRLVGPMVTFPESEENVSALVELHTESLVETVCHTVMRLVEQSGGGGEDIEAIGVALPGVMRAGVVEDSPNLPQLKGARVAELLAGKLRPHRINAPVNVVNDADGVAAGLAAATGKLDCLLRVWSLGVGIGYGRYPFAPGIWEGGHAVVTLDEKENFCGCGGRGHIEGIMGHRAMRLRFLDMEPEEVFAEARNGNAAGSNAAHGSNTERCRQFVKLWHKALAAGCATSIHQDGPGKFLLTGFNVRFVDLPTLKEYIHQMVKMSPLQSYTIEIVEENAETRVIGAAVAAEQAANGR